jgi:hypothetical protein
MRKTNLKRQAIPEGPIQEFARILDKTPPDEWQRRTNAFTQLVNMIPTGSAYDEEEEIWFNSPPILRHLSSPLSDLLKDPRSTVVKRTCESCALLFDKCQRDARYLLKDIMPTVMEIHGQTVHVIRQCVQTLISEALSVVPCKMAMPIWMDRMKADKAITVREACAFYLGIGIQEWTEEGYLTNDVYTQVGSALIKAMGDQAPAVRQTARKGLENLNYVQPNLFSKLVDDREVCSNTRVRKTLKKIQAGEDDVSSTTSSRIGSVHSRGYGGSTSGHLRNVWSPPYNNSRPTFPIPETIGVRTPSRKKQFGYNPPARKLGGGLGPPVRVAQPFSTATDNDDALFESPPPAKHNVSDDALFDSPPPVHNLSDDALFESPSPQQLSSEVADDALFESPPLQHLSSDDVLFEPSTSHIPKEDKINAVDELSVIANANDLRESGRQRASTGIVSLLQERFSKFSISDSQKFVAAHSDESAFLSEILDKTEDDIDQDKTEDAITAPGNTLTQSQTPKEHTNIAQELLESHKRHVDQVMETLRVEMDALRDFETLLLEDVDRLTEEEVLQYFESVGLCLEARTKAGITLQKKMDKISQGGT